MSYLKIYQKDFKAILIGASILPVVCFIGGVYTGWSSQPQPSVNETLSETQASERDVSAPDRSERNDLYAKQNESVNTDDLDPDPRLPGENDGEGSKGIESMDASKAPESSLTDVADDRNQLPENLQHGVAGKSSIKERTEFKYTLSKVSSLQSINEFLVQAGRFNLYENAVNFQAELTAKSLPSQVALDDSAAQPAFLVIVSSFASKDEAKRYCHFAEAFYQLEFYVKPRGGDLKNSSESFASL